jgi:hypothetical protein
MGLYGELPGKKLSFEVAFRAWKSRRVLLQRMHLRRLGTMRLYESG